MSNVFIHIVKDSDGEIVKKIDVTGQSERSIDRTISGISSKLNHDEYSIEVHDEA